MTTIDTSVAYLLIGFTSVLLTISAGVLAVGRLAPVLAGHPTTRDVAARVRGWWVIVAAVTIAIVLGEPAMIALFFVVSLLALREMLALVPTARGDHATLAAAVWLVTPIQYWLVAHGDVWMFTVFIPLAGSVALATGQAIGGETRDYLARAASLYWSLLLCVWSVSHVPALLALPLPDSSDVGLGVAGIADNVKLILYLLVVTQISDVLQYVWGKSIGRHRIAPTVSPHKTWEGFIGGVASASMIGAALWWLTPFTPLVAGVISLTMTLLGFAGGLVMSAVKRDRGVKDYGGLLRGHGGVLDRLDSLVFSAPVFFHLTRWLVG
jgi:phosphatidate cytidylyltransferase